MDKELDNIIKSIIPKLHKYVNMRVSNRDDAEDIVQDTIYQFLRTINVLENPIVHVSSWLYTVAHNLIINHSKRHHFMEELSDIMIVNDKNTPDIQMLQSMVWEELHKAIEELPKEQRAAIVLTEIEGKSVKEAAEIMSVSQNTFLSRKHYAVKRIRKRLEYIYKELINS